MGIPVEKFDICFSKGDSGIYAYRITKQYEATEIDIAVSISEVIHVAGGFTSRQSAWADAKAWLLTNHSGID